MLFILIILNLFILYYNWESLKYNCDVVKTNLINRYIAEGYDEDVAEIRAEQEIKEVPFNRVVVTVKEFFEKIKESFS